MAEPLVRYDVSDDGVGTLTLNRPDRLNAISPDLARELVAALERAAADHGVRCIVLTGAGRGFCAGGDLGVMHQRDGNAQATVEELEQQTADRAWLHEQIPLRLYEMDKPTIAAVNGAAAGAGLSLALACDLRLAAETAKFTTGFSRVGRSGDFGGTFFLSRLIGPSRSRELYFTSETVLADRALELGLVDHVHPADEVLTAATELARRIAAGPPHALARMKEAFRKADGGDLRGLLQLEARLQTLSGNSDEGRSFLARFTESRPRR
jgi:2-(1,2-epoxy-1,2-dihydrophenyl)acetyl-CoA isomerase